MNTFISASDFDAWLSNLKDHKAKARILARLQSAVFGNFSDCEPIGGGGDKSTQKKDIARAIKLARELKDVK